MKSSKKNTKKLKKIKEKKQENKLIVSHEPDTSFEDDFVDFVQEILDYD